MLHVCRYSTKGATFARVELYEARKKEREAAAREGRDENPVDAKKITKNRRVISASEALMRIIGMNIATWQPKVKVITVYPPGEEVMNAEENVSAQEARDTYVPTLARYFGRPPQFAHLNICDFFGQTNSASVESVKNSPKKIPDHAEGNAPEDSCTKNPHRVWANKQGNETLAGLVAAGPINSEPYWLRQLLLLPDMCPRDFCELCTFEGVTYNTCALAADARGLMKNGRQAPMSLQEECGDLLSCGYVARGHLVALIRGVTEVGDLLQLVKDFKHTLCVGENWPEEKQLQNILLLRYRHSHTCTYSALCIRHCEQRQVVHIIGETCACNAGHLCGSARHGSVTGDVQS